MKIALIIERMEPSRGGRETSTAQIAQRLAELGHSVTVLCQQGSWPSDSPGVEVVSLGKGSLRKFVAAAIRQCAPGRFDITHAMLPIPGASIYQPRGGTIPAQVRASLARVKCPLSRLGKKLGRLLNPPRRYMARLEKKLAADTRTLWIPGSKMVAGELARYYGRTENVRVVFNGVALLTPAEGQTRREIREQIRSKLGLAQDEPVFLTVATNFELKGVDFAIAALAELRRLSGQGVLIAVGREAPAKFIAQAKALGVADAVHFIPPVADIFPWYAAADICLLLSWYDACSRVILEACRLGIPSITTDFNGAAEALGGGAGLVVATPADTRAVVNAMQKMIAPASLAGRGSAAAAHGKKLSIARHVGELVKIYSQIAEAK